MSLKDGFVGEGKVGELAVDLGNWLFEFWGIGASKKNQTKRCFQQIIDSWEPPLHTCYSKED